MTQDSLNPQTLSAPLRQWLLEQAQRGCSRASLLQSMLLAGWQEALAQQALDQTLPLQASANGGPPFAGAQTAPAVCSSAETAQPGPDLLAAPRLLDAGDRQVELLLSLSLPRLLLFGGLLAEAECEELIAQAQPRLSRSVTVERDSGNTELHPSRTSQGMFFQRGQTELCARIEARIARLLQWPVECAEGLQVLRYGVGAEYKPHYDYFDPAHSSSATLLRRGGQRVGTLIIYLNEPERGGATTFPDVGLEVLPKRGHAVFFAYAQAHPSSRTLHAGAPVWVGEKWIATKWLRERAFV